MARPIKIFSSDEAIGLIRTFWLKSRILDWGDFQKNLRIDPALSGDKKREQLTETSYAAKQALDVLMKSPDKDAAPAALRTWIDTYLSAEGWKRVQAARRQKKNVSSNRDLLTKINKKSSWDFAYLAAAAGMTKKDYLSQLAGWMINQDAGKKAAAAFAASIKQKT